MMSRTTSEGVAPVALLVELFDLSRAAYYQALRGGDTKVSTATAKKEPKPARYAAAAVVLAAIRVIVGEHRAWGVRRVGNDSSMGCRERAPEGVRSQINGEKTPRRHGIGGKRRSPGGRRRRLAVRYAKAGSKRTGASMTGGARAVVGKASRMRRATSVSVMTARTSSRPPQRAQP